MIKKFIDKLLGKAPSGAKAALGKRVELAQAEHGIDRGLLDANAVKVVQTLKEAGFEAYVVGGAVRDELLGLPVKDRDWVVVGATPQDMLAQGYLQVGRDFPVFLHPQSHEEYALARTERKTAPGLSLIHI